MILTYYWAWIRIVVDAFVAGDIRYVDCHYLTPVRDFSIFSVIKFQGFILSNVLSTHFYQYITCTGDILNQFSALERSKNWTTGTYLNWKKIGKKYNRSKHIVFVNAMHDFDINLIKFKIMLAGSIWNKLARGKTLEKRFAFAFGSRRDELNTSKVLQLC